MLGSNVKNIRYNGTGRAYVGEVAGADYIKVGEMGSLNFGQTVSTEKLQSTQYASRATILEVDGEREPTISIGMRELSEENLQIAYLGSAINQDNQAVGYADQVVPGYVDDRYVDLGHLNVYITKITGAITGSLTLGSTVTGASSGATAKIAHIGSGFVILVNVVGNFTSGENVEQSAGTIYITATSIEKLEDVCITDVTGATLRVQGDDYDLDPDYGMLRKESGGAITGTDVVSYDYEAVARKYIHGLSSGSAIKKIIIVTDKDDQGPRKRYTFHKVKLAMNGDMPIIGDGVSELALQGSVLFDSNQPSGQEYYKVEIMQAA